ncbi:MAG: ribbon-helix-helix protein, CopG family [Solirubrobacterales bacterium]|nr:ribbon-helix-helix protein, CopG family [Solirubrobacterales bacterium]
MTLTRTQISLSEDDRAVLDAMRRRTGQSMSALIRDAIHSTYGSTGSADSILAALDSTFGTVSTDRSGEELVDSIRSGRRLTES